LLSLLAVPAVSRAQQWPPPHHGFWGPPWRAPVAHSATFRIDGSVIQVDFAPGPLDLSTAQVLDWVKNAASSVATYYGRFPVSLDRILIVPAPGREGVLQGTTWGDVGGNPAFTRMRIGQHTTADDLNRDWMMTHEMVHTAFPTQQDDHHWIEEGLATYIEPVARVHNGLLPARKIWWDMMRDMPQGDPPPGDKGLDLTQTWGLTYWGGAQFCLLADVEIREQTHNRMGLEDALRGIVNHGGNISQNWPLTKALAVGDAATGTHVLEDLYARMGDHPVKVDLTALWKKLGVVREGDGVRFDRSAPEASIRKAITAMPATGRIAPRGYTPAPVPANQSSPGPHVQTVAGAGGAPSSRAKLTAMKKLLTRGAFYLAQSNSSREGKGRKARLTPW